MFTSFIHPLSTFPSLLDFALISPFIIRLAVGILRFFAGMDRYKKEYKYLSIFYIVSGLMLIFGWYTQIGAIVAIILTLLDYFLIKKSGTVSREQTALTILITVMLLSLLFSGPGILSFDLAL
jgi:uncharacterized membrane protein YphA (DoxX/SURF4 family)